MNKNLFVGNLANEVTDEDLRVNFSEAGKVVAVNIIRDKYNGLSKGFGFVEMETEKDAQEAIKMFNGGTLRGKTITVNEARPKRDQGGYRGGGGGQGRGGFGRGGGGRRY
jgi:RNA recognition motif-containing protein